MLYVLIQKDNKIKFIIYAVEAVQTMLINQREFVDVMEVADDAVYHKSRLATKFEE